MVSAMKLASLLEPEVAGALLTGASAAAAAASYLLFNINIIKIIILTII